MDAIVGGRGEGKTQKLIEWAAKNRRRVIVAVDEHRAEQIKDLLRANLVAGDVEEDVVARRVADQVVTTSRMLRGLNRAGGAPQIAVDDLDAVLTNIFREPVTLVAFTGTAEQLGRAKVDAAEELIRMLKS